MSPDPNKIVVDHTNLADTAGNTTKASATIRMIIGDLTANQQTNFGSVNWSDGSTDKVAMEAACKTIIQGNETVAAAVDQFTKAVVGSGVTAQQASVTGAGYYGA